MIYYRLDIIISHVYITMCKLCFIDVRHFNKLLLTIYIASYHPQPCGSICTVQVTYVILTIPVNVCIKVYVLQSYITQLRAQYLLNGSIFVCYNSKIKDLICLALCSLLHDITKHELRPRLVVS
jgi:hypothetical protein